VAASSGRRVLVTRAAAQAEELAGILVAQGFEPLFHPLLTIAPPVDPQPLQRALLALADFDWVVVSSANGVEQVAAQATRLGRVAAWPRLAAVGLGTARAARAAGLGEALVPDQQDAEGLLAMLAPLVSGLSLIHI